MTIFVTEEMLEREVAEFLAKRLNANVIEQGSLRRPRRQFDILLQLDGERVVVEMEIGEGWRKIVEGIVQANDYKERLKADGIITVVYPTQVRKTVEPKSKFSGSLSTHRCRLLSLRLSSTPTSLPSSCPN